MVQFKKLKRLSLGWLPLFIQLSLNNKLGVRAECTLKGLPQCQGDTINTAEPCKKADDLNYENGAYCINGNNIYKNTITAEAEGENPATGTCEVQTTANQYYIFECSSDTFTLASGYTGTQYLVYQYDGSTLTQNPKSYYYNSSNNKLLYCNENTPAICTPVTNDGYYINPDTDTTASFSDHPLLLYSSSGTPTLSTVPKASVIASNEYYVDGEKKDDSATKYTQLISCTVTDDSVSTCTSATQTEGYYINSGSDKDTNPLIHCSGSDCETVAKVDGFYVNSGNDKSTKNLIKCNTDGCSTISSTGDTYIDASSETSSGSGKFSQLIKIASDGTITTPTVDSNYDGYYVDEFNKNDQSEYTSIIYCSTVSGTSSCSSITDFQTGYYINKAVSGTNANALISCTASSTCKLETGSGYYENTDDTTKIIKCTTDGCDNTTTTVGENNVYIDAGYPDTNDASKFSKLIKCIKDTNDSNKIKCTSDGTITDGYYIDESSKDSNVYKNIIKCTSSSCESIEVSSTNDGYYGDEMYNTPDNGKSVYSQLIKCTTTEDGSPASSCTSISNNVTGFYLNKNVSGTNENALIHCTASSTCKLENGNGYYVNVSNNNHLITCTSEFCYIEDATIKGYLKNAGTTTDSTKNVIKCDGTACTEENDSDSFSGVGSVKVESSNISICISGDCTGTDDIVSISPSDDKYVMLDIPDNGFPSFSTATKIPVKIGTDGSAIYLEDASLPECNVITGNVPCINNQPEQSCYKKDDDGKLKIYTTTIDDTNPTTPYSCNVVIGSNSNLYFDIFNRKVDTPSSTNTPSMTYYCKSDDNSCTLMKGYVSIDETTAIQCSGWKREKCNVITITNISDTIDGEGELTKENKLQFNSNNIFSIPEAGKTDYYSFKTTKVNTIYGQPGDEIIFVAATSSSVLLTSADDGIEDNAILNGYHVNVAETSQQDGLIKCTDGTCTMYENVRNGYYINSGSDRTTNQIIECVSDGCSTKAAENSCTVAGKVFKDNTGIKLCVNIDDTNNLITNDLTSVSYETINLAASTSFPGTNVVNEGQTEKIAVKINSDKSIILMEDASLPECDEDISAACTANDIEVDYCIKNDSSIIKLYMKGESTCNEVTNESAGKKVFYSNDKGIKITDPTNAENPATVAYVCTFEEGESNNIVLSSCELGRGYNKFGDNYIQCNGWKGETCTVSTLANCANDDNGKLGTGPSICFSSTETSNFVLPTGSNVATMAFELLKTSEIYGGMKGDILVLDVSSDQVLVTGLNDVDYDRYFINYNYDPTDNESKKLIKCATGGKCELEENKIGYYLNSGYEEIITIGTPEQTPRKRNTETSTVFTQLISCTENEICTSVSSESSTTLKEGHYADASGATEATINEIKVTTYAGLIICSKGDIDEDIISCKKENDVVDGYYFDASKEMNDEVSYEGLIKCSNSESSCVLEIPKDEKTYYRSIHPDSLNGALYKCGRTEGSSSSTCSLVTETAKQGYYVNGGTNHLIDCDIGTASSCVDKEITSSNIGYYIDSGSDGSEQTIILCNKDADSNPETFSCHSISHQGTNQKPTHYLDAATNRVITCNSEKCFLEDSDVKGYFLNDSTLTSSTSHVISCGASSQCEELLDSSISSVTDIGKVKYSGEKASLCLTENCESAVDITGASDNVYKTLEISATNDFPGVTISNDEKKKIPIKISKNGSAIMMTDASIPVCESDVNTDTSCTNDNTSGQYCIDNDKKIHLVMTDDDGTKTNCILAKIGDIYYFSENGVIMEEPSLEGTETSKEVNVIAYQCSFDSTDGNPLKSCELAKGYTKIYSITPKYIYCSGWKGEGCVVSSTALSDCTLINTDEMENGKLGMVTVNGNEKVIGICATADFVLPETDTTTITLELTQTSEIYGKMQDEIITLSLSSDKALIVADTTEQDDEKYYINYNDNAVGEEIITCKSTGCEKGPSKFGYYLDASYMVENGDGQDKIYTQLIECAKDGATCTSIEPNDGYYIDATTSSNIIHCISNSNDEKDCTSSTHDGSDSSVKHFLGGNSRVITCTTSCFLEDSAVKGYFINDGVDNSTKHIISCNGSQSNPCNLDDDNDSTTTIGNIKYASDSASLCINSDCTQAVPASSDTYEKLGIESANDFPGAEAGKTISVKIGEDGTVILLEEMTGLPECSSSITDACFTDAKDGQYCFVKNNGNISGIKRTNISSDGVTVTKTCTDIIGSDIVTDGTANPKTVISDAGTHVLFFNADGQLIETPAASDNQVLNVVAYQCTFEGTGNEGTAPFKISNCVRVKGYAIDGDNIIQCSGWKREGCLVTANSSLTDCTTNDRGKIGTGNKICFDTNSISLPENTDSSNIAFKTDDINSNYGIAEGKVVFLHLTATNVLVVDSSDSNISTIVTEGYHRNVSVNKVTTEGFDNRMNALLKCETAGSIDSCISIDAFSGYYLNAGSDATSLPLLKCSKTDGCIASDTQASDAACAIGDVDSDKKISIDCDESNPISIQIAIDNTENAKAIYETIESSSDTPAYPDTETSKKYPIKIRPDGSAILLEDISLPVCTAETLPSTDSTNTLCKDNALNGQHCIKEGIIYVSTVNGSNVSCAKMEINDGDIKYFTKDGLNVELANASTPDMAYQCTKDDNDNVSCILAKGITSVTTDGIVYCNGWIDEKCQTVSTTDISSCGAEDINNGAFGTVTVDTAEASGLCFTSNNVIVLPTDDNKSVRMAFEFSKTSSVYGQMAGTISVLTLTNKSALIKSDYGIEDDNVNEYFINYNHEATDATDNDRKSELITCSNTGCVVGESNPGYYFDAGYDETDDNSIIHTRLISCLQNECTSLSISELIDGYYVDASQYDADNENTYIGLIKCTITKGTDPEPDSISCEEFKDDIKKTGYYINALYKDENDAIIYCVFTEGSPNTVSCAIKPAEANEIYLNNDEDTNLIQCYDKEDDKFICEGFTGTGTENIPAYYLNAGSTNESLNDAIIVCEADSCEIEKTTDDDGVVAEHAIFFNANLKGTTNGKTDSEEIVNLNQNDEAQLIICGETTCEKILVEIAENGHDLYYVNAGEYINTADSKIYYLIKCTYGSGGSVCTADVNELTSVEKYYINGNYEKDNSYVIKCDNAECKINNPTTGIKSGDVEFYINGAANGFNEAVIKVSFTAKNSGDENTSRKRETSDTQQENENTNNVQTETETLLVASCELKSANKNDIFIDASGDKKIIQCYETTSPDGEECVSKDSWSEYFVNADPDLSTSDYINDLILCNEQKCEYANGDKDKVFINGNYYVSDTNDNGDTINNLIICSENKCEAKQITTDTGNLFFVNGAKETTDDYTGSLIKCTGTAAACTAENGEEDKIYINGNFKKDGIDSTDTEHQLILCNTEEEDVKKCTAFESKTSTYEYYINADFTYNANADADDIYKDALIKCTKDESSGIITCTGDTPPINNDDKREVFYVNANYENDDDNKYLIQCTSSQISCITYSSDASISGVEYYIHGGVSDDDYTEAIIKVVLEEVTGQVINGREPSGRRREQDIFKNDESSTEYSINNEEEVTSEVIDDIFSNDKIFSLNEKLNDGLSGSSEEVTDDIEIVNVPEEELVNIASNTVKVTSFELLDGKDNDIYINTSSKKLIQCQTVENVKSCKAYDSIGGSGNPAFYVNADPIEDNYADSLISCDDQECTFSDLAGDKKVFVNANYYAETINNNGDKINRLIICGSNRCKVENVSVDSGKAVYFVNGAANQNKSVYSDFLIKCQQGTEKCGPYEGGVNNVYFNGNYKGEGNIYATDNENQLIVCNNGSSVGECECVVQPGKSGNNKINYYVNAGAVTATSLEDTLIECNNRVCSPKDLSTYVSVDRTEVFFINKIFENNNDESNYLIKCSLDTKNENTSQGCTLYPGNTSVSTEDGNYYYVHGAPNGLTNAVIEVSISSAGGSRKRNNKTVRNDNPITPSLIKPNSYDIFINTFNSQLIQCSSSRCESTDDHNGTDDIPTYFVNADRSIPEKEDNPLAIIKCNEGDKCKGETVDTFDVYLNGNLLNEDNPNGESNKPLIICSSGNICETKNSLVGEGKNVYYINAGTYKDEDSKSRVLIQCSKISNKVSCESYLVTINESSDSSPTDVYFVNGNYGGEETNYLINCTDTDICTLYSTNSDNISEGKEHYVNGFIKNSESNDLLTGAVIECVITKNEENTIVNCVEKQTINSYDMFINSATNTLIQCSTEKGCISINRDSENKDILGQENEPTYFVNAGKYTVESDTFVLIKCTETCEAIAIQMGSGQPNDVFYINGNYGTDAPSDLMKYLIHCTATDRCVTYSKTDAIAYTDEYYVHGAQDDFSNAVIKCSITDVANDNISSECGFVDSPSENFMYINSSDGNLIQCSVNEENKPSCNAFKGVVGSTSIPAYYVNGSGESADDKYTKLLIECKGNGKCVEYGEESNDFTNYVYINSNYNYVIQNDANESNESNEANQNQNQNSSQVQSTNPNPNGDNENRLIICSKNGTNASCTPKDVSVTDGNYYYVNGGSTNLASYVNILIKCSSSGPCTLINGANNNVYLNGNFKKDSTSTTETDEEHQLIICSDNFTDITDKCQLIESQLSDTSDIKFEYYLNAGKYINDDNNYLLIKCTFNSSTTCEPQVVTLGKGSTQEVYYINGNYVNDNKYIIHCTDLNNCSLYSNSRSISNSIEYYVHGGQSEFDDAVIKCEINADGIVDTTIGCTFTTNAESGSVYINSSNNNLIQCSKDGNDNESCNAFNGVLGSNTEPAYYVNGDPPATPTDYNNLLIKCIGSGKCSLFNGSDKSVYINSNFHDTSIEYTTDNPDSIPNGDIENRIIICNENNNNKKECTVGKVEVDDGKNLYYVNGGAINSKSSSYTNLLIKCSSTATSKCTLESSNEDNIYLNGNVDIDSLPLINCNNKECIGIEITEDGYYVNSAESTGAPLTYTLIKCEEDRTCEEEPVEGVDGETVTEVFYLNKNYGENDPINYLIKCNVTDGCVPYGTAKPKEDTVEHYVHGAQTNLDDAVIKVSFERITNTPSKRALNLETTISFESASINDIYINSFNEQLIQCYKDDNSKEGCAAYKSEAEENKPLYYVNAENKNTESETYEKLLIKCDAKCQAANGAVNNVYLNGNLKSDENANGDTDNQLIICNDKKCSASKNSASTDSEYYVNSGAYNAIPLVDTLIECADNSGVKCVTKDISEKIDGTYIKELFFINKNSDKDTQNYVIKCNKVKGCKPYSTGLTVGNEYFINGGNKTKEDSVIQCKFTDNVADCKTDKATTGAEDKQIYLNAANKKQIIRCTTDGCKAVDSAPTDNRSEFYMNGDDHVASENGNNGGAEGEENTGVKVNSLIKCSKANSCEVLEIGDEEANKVYRNANFLENADTTNQLIKCSKGICELGVSKATVQLPEYYFNADDTYKDLLKEDIIECINKDNKITCTPITAKPNYVYVNSDFSDDNTNPVIACSAEKGCIELGSGGDENSFVYFVNAGSHSENPLDDTLIECSSGCNVISALNDEYYINALDPSQIIYCTEKKGCTTKKSNATKEKKEIYLNASDLKKNTEEIAHANDLIICTNTDNKIECVAGNGDENGIYVNAGTPGEIIQCNKDQPCQKVSMVRDTKDESPYYFVNSDPLSKEDPPLINDLIKCRSIKGRVSCDVVNGNDGDVYLNGNVLNDSDNLPLIKCTSKDGCITSPSRVDETSPPEFYINSGSYQANRLNDTLIECTYENEQAGCAITIANENDIYVNYADNKDEHPLIQCAKSGCKVFDSNADEDNKEYYKNAGDSGEPDLVYDMIECSMTNNKKTCVEIKDVTPGIYLNSNYAERGDKHQIIECNKDSGCQGHQTSQDKTVEYYVNAEATGLANAIIYCYNKKCEKQTPTEIPTFYVGKDKELNGLIECTGDSLAAAKCTLTPAFTSQGYYLNGGYNKAINQTIICDSEEGCTSLKVNLGYYVNAGDAEKQIIKCENENQECTAENVECPTSDETAKSGNYCYSNGQLKFYPAGNSTAVLASKSDDFYTYATIPSNGFPGIKKDISTLFKVSYYYINRFFQNGVVVIDKNGKLLSSLDSEQSDTNLYDCNESTKICTLRPGCTPYTYMYDTENGKALFCNEYERLKYAEFNGYVIDGNRAIGNLHPYLIYCEQNGKKCVTGRAKTTSYYENSGYDSSTNALIACANNNCVTTTAEVGYYVGHDGAGIIQCTSANACIYSKAKGDVRYLNAGANKSSHAIINCSRKGSTTICKTEKGRENYYLTHVSNRLIYCSTSTSCEEITPSATYYNNAVSTGNGDGLIQCEESGATIQCSIKSSKIGFYLSAFSNKLISCSHGGSKCVTKSFDNGYFHEPIKRDPAKTNNSARSDEESILHESLNNNTLDTPDNLEALISETTKDNDSQEEEEKVVNVSRNEDEVYGIIHCIAGKCKSLSPEELANIPICEFNNNKCYITLEYSMMKSSTTSLAAGNICTNSDRSVFYFATDTIVVKPNVIAGVTSTYVYTTTNSNCLEVNDSYNDMYFTVRSNIYLLDEGSVMQFYDPGYFFINTATNTLVTDNDIDAYNDENVKLYHCNGSFCRIVNKPTTLTYFTDVNKRIMKYNVQSESYSFAYDKDIICIFSNNKCTPNADLNGREFCITYKGELALARSDIKNRETGECFKSSSISNKIYGISQYLYAMTSNQANRIQESGYYMVNLSTNTTVQNINVKGRNNNLVLYGCILNNCKEYEPESNTYYYDERAKMMYRYENGVWRSPKTSGYALVSVDPNTKYIYSFTLQQDSITLGDTVNFGYHYTIDNEMYQCTKNAENGECHTIDDSDYYFTEEGGIYYCVYDSENREPTECTQQICNNGQYYYINEKYYRCESGSILTPVRSRHCSMTEEVVMNFPIALTTEYPENVKRAMEDIQKNNNSTGIVTRRTKNFLSAVSGIFTNCTYDVEETKSTFDLVCINNYVQVDKKSNELKICSVEQKGYVECIEDEENPNKCHASAAWLSYIRPSIIYTLLLALLISLFNILI